MSASKMINRGGCLRGGRLTNYRGSSQMWPHLLIKEVIFSNPFSGGASILSLLVIPIIHFNQIYRLARTHTQKQSSKYVSQDYRNCFSIATNDILVAMTKYVVAKYDQHMVDSRAWHLQNLCHLPDLLLTCSLDGHSILLGPQCSWVQSKALFGSTLRTPRMGMVAPWRPKERALPLGWKVGQRRWCRLGVRSEGQGRGRRQSDWRLKVRVVSWGQEGGWCVGLGWVVHRPSKERQRQRMATIVSGRGGGRGGQPGRGGAARVCVRRMGVGGAGR